MDIKNLFNVELPAALLLKTKEVKKVNAVFQVNITGEGSWRIDTKSAEPSVSPSEVGSAADCTLTISSADFLALMKTPSKATTMVLFGKLKIAGNKMLAMELTKLLG